MTDRTEQLEKVLQLALEALEELQYAVVDAAKTDDVSLYYRAIAALRESLGTEFRPSHKETQKETEHEEEQSPVPA